MCLYWVAVGCRVQPVSLASATVDETHAASSFTLRKQQHGFSGAGSNPCKSVPRKEGKKERSPLRRWNNILSMSDIPCHFVQVNHKLGGGKAVPFRFYSHINYR